jgi:hypothetical protein
MNSDDLAKRMVARLTKTPPDWQAEVTWREGETPEEYHARFPWLPADLMPADEVITLMPAGGGGLVIVLRDE